MHPSAVLYLSNILWIPLARIWVLCLIIRLPLQNSEEYAKCYCKFFTITQFLIRKSWLSESEQSHLFQWGFQPSLWARIEWQLKVKIPNHYPGDPYKFEDIKEAATHVLRGTRISSEEPWWAETVVNSTITPVPAPVIKGSDVQGLAQSPQAAAAEPWKPELSQALEEAW